MAGFEERLAFLEGRVGEHSQMLTSIRDAIVSLEQRMEHRFQAIERRFEAMERRLDSLDQKLDLRTAALDQKLDQRFAWLLGVQITTLVAIVAALLAR